MRRLLPLELRRRFDIAWGMLPRPVQERLRRFICSVRAVKTLKGAVVRCADGSVFYSEQDGAAWFAYDGTTSRRRGFLLILKSFEAEPEAFAVATILHELAHAVQYEEQAWETTQIREERSEAAAWLQAAAWAAHCLDGYARAADVADMAVDLALPELLKWRLGDLLHTSSPNHHPT